MCVLDVAAQLGIHFAITKLFYLQCSQGLTTLSSNFLAQCLRSRADKELDRRLHRLGHLTMEYPTDPIAHMLVIVSQGRSTMKE